MTSPSGAILWSARYRAYGNVARLDVAEIDNPLRFQGQYYDAETGLHYNRHRYYNPGTGRFLTPDPIRLAGGLNHYQYVPNPTGWVDPLGLSCCPDGDTGKLGTVVDPVSKARVDEGAPTTPTPDFYIGPSGPSSTLPATGYRYMRYKNDDGSINKYAQQALETGEARLSYFGFDKFESGDAVTDALQIRRRNM